VLWRATVASLGTRAGAAARTVRSTRQHVTPASSSRTRVSTFCDAGPMVAITAVDGTHKRETYYPVRSPRGRGGGGGQHACRHDSTSSVHKLDGGSPRVTSGGSPLDAVHRVSCFSSGISRSGRCRSLSICDFALLPTRAMLGQAAYSPVATCAWAPIQA